MPRAQQRQADDLPDEYHEALGHVKAERFKEAMLAFDSAIRSQPDNIEIRKARASLLKQLLGDLIEGSEEALLGGKPRGSNPLIVLKPGPSVSDAIIDERR
jgi:hypothetical protein